MVNGEKLALEEAGGKVGKFEHQVRSLDDCHGGGGQVGGRPGLVQRPQGGAGPVDHRLPRRVQLGRHGDLDADHQRGRHPAGLAVEHGAWPDPQEGADKGEPDKYYPSGKRTYGRVVPADHIQAAAQVDLQKDEGCTKLYIVNDKEVYGKGLADQVARIAKAQGLQVMANEGIDTKSANFRTVANKIKSSGADCMFFGGITPNKGVQVWKDVHAGNPDIKLFGPDGVAEEAFTRSSARPWRSRPTSRTRPSTQKLYPPAAQKFFKTFEQKYGKPPEPYAIYGYEAMKVALLAIQNAGDKGNDRQAVIDAFYKIKDRDSVLGKYSIDENGDTTLSDYGARPRQGRRARVRQGHQGPDGV